MLKNHIRITEASKILGVSTKTLRRWSESGKLQAKRSVGGQRYYTYDQLRKFNKSSSFSAVPDTPPPVGNKILLLRIRRSISSVGFVFVWSLALVLILLGSGFISLSLKGNSPQKSAGIISKYLSVKTQPDKNQETKTAVLAATASTPVLSNYTFNVNVPSVFNSSVDFTRNIQAPNIVNSVQGKSGQITLTAGTGISISGTTITNSDPGSSQEIFRTIKVGSDTFSAGGNAATLEFTGSGATSVSIDTSNKKLTFSSTAPDYTQSGWTKSGTYVYPTTLTNSVGIGTASPEYALDVVGDGHFSGSLTVSDGIIVTDGINNQGGGITNAGAITGASGLTSSGQITFSAFSTGILHSNFNGVISSSAIDLSGSDVSSVLSAGNGGTGISSYSIGDILYASSSGYLARLSIGGEGEALTVENGTLSWGTVVGEGGTCTNCVLTDPGSTQLITPTNSGATGLSIKQADSGVADVFSVKSFSGEVTFFSIDSDGYLNIGNTSSSYLGALKTAALTENRNYTFPDYSGNVCLDTGNCAGVGSNLGGSGAAGYLSRWAGDYSLETGTIFDDGNIGIGTADPLTKLQVVGNASVSGALTLSSTLNTLGAANFSSTLGVTGATTLSSTLDITGNVTSGGNLKINGEGTSYVLGSFGVGTTEPGLALDVVGSSNVSGSYYLSTFLGLSKNENDLRINDEGDFTNTVISSGNLGVGTTSPAAKLDINQTSDASAVKITADAVTTGTAFDFSVDGLTTGTGVNIQSTSAGITAANLVNIDQTATKTSETAISGNVLSIKRDITYNPASPAITKDSQTENSGSSTNTLSLSHTVGTESNMILVAILTFQSSSSRSVNSITYDGVAMTEVGHADSSYGYTKTYIYYMLAPPTGSKTMSVTLSGSVSNLKLGAVSWYNVNQSTPFGDYGTYSSLNDEDSSITVSSAEGELVIDGYAMWGSEAAPDASQTILWNSEVGGIPMGASTKPGASSVTMKWVGTGNYPSSVAVPMKPIDVASLGISGAVASLSSNCSGLGTCADSANILSLSQSNSSATGGVIGISNSGTGADIAFDDSSILRMTDEGTMTWDDGTNTLLKLSDLGTTGLLGIYGSASSSGSLSFSGSNPYLDILNGSSLNIRTSVGGDDGLSSKFTIANDGKVGIGTTSPTANFDVAGDASMSGSIIFRGTSPSTIDILNGNRLDFQTSPGGDSELSAKVSILNNGNVGIATTSAAYKLDVAGIIRSTAGLSTFVKAGEISDADFSEAALDGLMAVDSTNGRLYVRSAGAWEYLAFVGGFQIPAEETEGLSTGDYLIPYVESGMNDGAVHGMYKKFSDVKDSLLSDIYDFINSLAARISTIENSFSELANKITTKESHQEKLCVGTDGNEVCLDKEQLGQMLQMLPTPTSSPAPEASPSPIPEVAGESTEASSSATPDPTGI